MVSQVPEPKSPFGGMTSHSGGGNMRLPDFPPTSPRHLRRPFSAATGSGRFAFLGASAHSRCALRDAETKGMGLAVAHEISPELVLVCPELRAHALTLLPTLDPDELFTVEPRPSPAPRPPLLALVEPEPARAEFAPDPRPRPGPAPQPASAPVPRAVVEPRPPLPLALAVYTSEALFLGVVRGVALIAVIAAVAFVLAR